MKDFVISVRQIESGSFIAEPGEANFLKVPEDAVIAQTAHIESDRKLWVRDLLKSATWGKDKRRSNGPRGDILVFIHGYNNSADEIMKRHRRLKKDLNLVGFKGEVVSFDWPCDDSPLGYLEDRHDAKKTAMQLVTDGIRLLAAAQKPGCAINVHLLGHSTGAYVAREAFSDADDSKLLNNAWNVSQIIFIGADVSVGSMAEGDRASRALYLHCARLTNYSSGYDSALKLSNLKRLGLAPRVGRNGLPIDAPKHAVNVDCSAYFEQLERDPAVRERDQVEEIGNFSHSWHIGNLLFAKDLFDVLKGDLDRGVFPTRMKKSDGALQLSSSV